MKGEWLIYYVLHILFAHLLSLWCDDFKALAIFLLALIKRDREDARKDQELNREGYKKRMGAKFASGSHSTS
jgi:hypothetical protein